MIGHRKDGERTVRGEKEVEKEERGIERGQKEERQRDGAESGKNEREKKKKKRHQAFRADGCGNVLFNTNMNLLISIHSHQEPDS